MAQEVKIAGATYSDVPSISVPDSNDEYHSFMDTSDATAESTDLLQGTTAYVKGVKLSGALPPNLSSFTDDLGTNPVHSHMMDSLNPIASNTFTGVYATSSNVNTLRPFMRVIPTEWDATVRIDYKVKAYVPSYESSYYQTSEVTLCFFHNALSAYSCKNFIGSTSYRPLYYHSHMRCAESYMSIGHLVGINFYAAGSNYSRNSTSSTYARTFEIEILHTENCSVTFLDECDTVSSSIVSGYVAGTTHTAITNLNGTTQGETHSGDANSNTVPTGYCTTGASTAAKVATCTYGYRDDPNYFPCLFRYANTASNATLAISSYATTALPIYVNGARTSSSNTFGAGVVMFLYYDSAYYCYNDGRFPIVYNGAVTSVQDVIATLGGSDVSVTQTLSSGTKIGSVTIDGTTTDLYAPNGGSDVSVSQTLTSGEEIGSITVGSTTTTLYAPSGGSSEVVTLKQHASGSTYYFLISELDQLLERPLTIMYVDCYSQKSGYGLYSSPDNYSVQYRMFGTASSSTQITYISSSHTLSVNGNSYTYDSSNSRYYYTGGGGSND